MGRPVDLMMFSSGRRARGSDTFEERFGETNEAFDEFMPMLVWK
jgi:hypothetical protein